MTGPTLGVLGNVRCATNGPSDGCQRSNRAGLRSRRQCRYWTQTLLVGSGDATAWAMSRLIRAVIGGGEVLAHSLVPPARKLSQRVWMELARAGELVLNARIPTT